MSTIDELRALEAAATPAPWEAVTANGPKRRQQQIAMVGRAGMRGQGEKGCLAVLAGLNAHRADDADLIAAVRNALPDLLERLERAERRVGSVVTLAERAARKGYGLDPDDVLIAAGEVLA